MKELIKISEHNGNKAVSARDLYNFLEINERFSRWFERMANYSLVEGVDYTPYQNVHPQNNQEIEDFALTMDCAKVIAMLQRNEKGNEARRYFIEVEKKFKQNQLDFSDPDAVLRIAQSWAESEKARRAAEAQVKSLKPKAELMDKVMETDEKIDIGQAAKILGLPYGRNTLFKKLRERGVFFKSKNEPMQEYINRGYFELKQKLIERKKHEDFTVVKVLITQRGLAYLSKIFDTCPTNGNMAKIE